MDHTILSRWLRLATPEQRKELAAAGDTSVSYLYVIAGGHRNNFKLRMAYRISEKSFEMSKRTGHTLPWITIDDLYALTNQPNRG